MRFDRIVTVSKDSDCKKCKHYTGGICRAYPDNIPVDIIRGKRTHRTVQSDQVGILVFEPYDCLKDKIV